MQESRYPQRSSPDRSATESEVSRPKPKTKHITSGNKSIGGRLFVLDLSIGHITSLNADGSNQKVIVSCCRHPNGGTFTPKQLCLSIISFNPVYLRVQDWMYVLEVRRLSQLKNYIHVNLLGCITIT